MYLPRSRARAARPIPTADALLWIAEIVVVDNALAVSGKDQGKSHEEKRQVDQLHLGLGAEGLR